MIGTDLSQLEALQTARLASGGLNFTKHHPNGHQCSLCLLLAGHVYANERQAKLLAIMADSERVIGLLRQVC